jgi:hypothetical protein
MNHLKEFFSNRFDDLLERVKVLSNETSRRFDDVNEKFDDVNKRFDIISADASAFRDETSRRFDDVNKKFDDVNKRFDLVNEKFADVGEDLFELLSSTQTPRSAALVDSCALQSVFFVRTASTSTNTSTTYRHCSAFAYQPFPSKKAVIVTASHCLSRPFMAPSNLTISITYLGDDVIHDCSVLYHQAPPEDSSILTCPGLTNLIGLVSSGSSRLSQSVAITGFAVDTFNSSSKKTSSKTRSHHVPYYHFNSSFALNVDFSRIVSVAGPPHKLKDGSLCVSSPSEDVWDVNPSGFVERQVREGMSGGPILDLKCGVVGISHGRSCNAGAYVDLTSVDLYIESMKSIP